MTVELKIVPAVTGGDPQKRDFFLGQRVTLDVEIPDPQAPPYTFAWRFIEGGDAQNLLSEPTSLGRRDELGKTIHTFGWNVEGHPSGPTDMTLYVYVAPANAAMTILPSGAANLPTERGVPAAYRIRPEPPMPLIAKEAADAVSRNGGLSISLQREPAPFGSSIDEGLWVRILAVTRGMSFPVYRDFIDGKGLELSESGTAAYTRLKEQTNQFLKAECQSETPHLLAQAVGEANGRLKRSFAGLVSTSLPSVDLVADRLPIPPDKVPVTNSDGVTTLVQNTQFRKLCLVELIWSYWHEEGMVVQAIKAISRRFQNRLAPGARDPLQGLEIDPLRPLSNLFWGYIQDEQYRISVIRRAHEYEHHYGISLQGKAIRALRPADRRTKFLESFHNLLFRCLQFYKQDDDKTVSADGFPVLNAIKETHYLVAHGAHSQFGDLPETDREEKLIEMWLLARPEMREFLRGRPMVPYPEDWMDRVDHMKSLQGWSDVSVVHFHDLAVFGEQLLLSIRYGSWSRQSDPLTAVSFARFWRQEVQGYIHAYRATTGVDLSAEVSDERALKARNAPPSVHLSRRLAAQGSR